MALATSNLGVALEFLHHVGKCFVGVDGGMNSVLIFRFDILVPFENARNGLGI